jgi:hypothetical protein
MSAVPLSKAGVGSAVNDTTRELGGALGIAILGSIANSAYRAGIDLSGLGLPGPARTQAGDSVGAAAGVAGTVPGGGEVQNRAADAFTHAFNVASAVSVGIALVAAAGVFVWSRSKGADAADEPAENFDFDFDLGQELVPVGAGHGPE